MVRSKSFPVVVIGGGVLLAGVIACSAGGQAPLGSSGATTQGGDAATAAAATGEPNNQASGSSMPTIDPCSIVTQDEAAAFFGVASGAGDASTGSLTAECDYRSTDNTSGLSLILAYVPGGALNSDQFNYMKNGNQDVPGLGEGACWVAATSQLDVAKGNWILTLNGAIKGQGVPLDKLTPLAQTALGRLP